jgi:Ca2+-binding RTX toxin-like protein
LSTPTGSLVVVNVNVGGTIVPMTVTGTLNAALAQQIASALDTASVNGTLSYATYTGSGSIPTVASGSTQELILPPTLSGSVTIPAASAGVQQILLATNTAPITINGSPNLQILGGGSGNVTISDPASIVLLDNGATTYTDAVTVTAADSPYTVAMRSGRETVVATGSGTIAGGSLKNLIDVSQSTGSNLIISEGSGGDTVFTGSGSTTIEATTAAKGGLYIDGAGSFDDYDQGTADTIVGNAAATASVTIGGSQALVFGGADSLVVVNTGSSNTVSAANSAASVTAAAGSIAFVLFGGTGTLNYVDDGGNDTVAAGTGAMSVTGSGNNLLAFGGTGGLQFVGAAGSSTVLAAAGGANTVSLAGGQVLVAVQPSASVTVNGGSGFATLYGGALSNVTLQNSGSSSVLYAAGFGNETLNGAGASASNQLFGGLDATGADSIVGGTGNDTLAAGSGSDTLVGNGADNLFVFFHANGAAAPQDVIGGYQSNDLVVLSGYGTAAASIAQADATLSGGNTTITLADNTKITFLGVTSASSLHLASN